MRLLNSLNQLKQSPYKITNTTSIYDSAFHNRYFPMGCNMRKIKPDLELEINNNNGLIDIEGPIFQKYYQKWNFKLKQKNLKNYISNNLLFNINPSQDNVDAICMNPLDYVYIFNTMSNPSIKCSDNSKFRVNLFLAEDVKEYLKTYNDKDKDDDTIIKPTSNYSSLSPIKPTYPYYTDFNTEIIQMNLINNDKNEIIL